MKLEKGLSTSIKTTEKKVPVPSATEQSASEEKTEPTLQAGHCQHCHSTNNPVWLCSVVLGANAKQMNLCEECMMKLRAKPVN